MLKCMSKWDFFPARTYNWSDDAVSSKKARRRSRRRFFIDTRAAERRYNHACGKNITPKILSLLLLLFIIPSLCYAVGNENVNTLPDSNKSTFRTDSRAMWQNEIPDILSRYFKSPDGWVYQDVDANSGYHGTATGCKTTNFNVEAFTTQGRRVRAAENGTGTAVTLDYALIGSICPIGTYTVRIAACATTADSIGNWIRFPTTNIFGNIAGGDPATPTNCARLLDATISSGNITATKDLRVGSPLSQGLIASKLEESLNITILWIHATSGTGTYADPYKGWESSINGMYDATIWITPGIYETPIGVTFPEGRINVIGFGPRSTVLMLAPTTHDKTLITFGKCTGVPCNGTGPDTDASFSNLFTDINLASTDNTYRKTALHLIDVRASTFRNIAMGEPGFADASRSSIALFLEGRDTSNISKASFVGNRPMVIGGSPNSDLNAANRNLDHFVFRDIDTIVYPQGLGKNVEILPSTYITNVTVEGHFDMNRGDYGVYGVLTSTMGSFNNRFSNMRHEQAYGTDGWAFYLESRGLYHQQLIIENFLCCGAGNGIYLRGFVGVHISDYTYPGFKVALNIAGALGSPFTHVYPLVCDRCWAQENTTALTASSMVLASNHRVTVKDPPSYYGNNLELFAAFPSSSRFVIDIPQTSVEDDIIVPYIPLLVGTTTPGTTTYTINKGYWVKKNKMVQLHGHLIVNSYDLATEGQIYIGSASDAGFPPATAQPSMDTTQFYSCALSRVSKITLPAIYAYLTADIPYGNNNVNLLAVGSGQISALLGSGLDPVPFEDGSELSWSCAYITD